MAVDSFVAVVVVRQPKAKNDKVARTSRREFENFFVERHRAACVLGLIATGVQWIPLAAVVNDVQARNVNAPIAVVIMQIAPLNRCVPGRIDECGGNGVVHHPLLCVVR